MKLKNKELIMFVFTLFICVKSFTQHNLKNVEANILNYKNKNYGVNDLNLLIYPSIKEVRDTLLSQNKSNKCKVYVKLKIISDSKMIIKKDIISDCKFEELFDYKSYLKNNLNIYIFSIDTNEESIEMTIPIHIYKN